jgi:hypothetical protein
MFEIATMTAEEREFYLEWFVEQKRKENEARENASNRASPAEPKFGPAAT